MLKILLAGCGDIGSALGVRLMAQGHDVIGLKRRPPEISGSIRYFAGDVCNAASLDHLANDIDLIVYTVTPDRRDPEAYQAVYERGLQTLLDKFAQQHNTPQWFFVSSTSVYGHNDGSWVDETSETLPEAHNGQILLAAERLIMKQSSKNLVIRFSGIYGPGRTRLLEIAKRGKEIQHTPPYYTNRIHRDDCVGVLLYVLQQKLAGTKLEPCYLASDDEPVPMWEVISWLARELDFEQPRKRNEDPNAPQNKRCCNKRIKALGYRFEYPGYRDGYRKIVMQESKVL